MKNALPPETPEFPFGSCQYGTAFASFAKYMNDEGPHRNAKPRAGFTKEVVLLMLNAASDCAWDLWGTMSVVPDFAIENYHEILETLDDDEGAGFACACLAIAFNLDYADFPGYST